MKATPEDRPSESSAPGGPGGPRLRALVWGSLILAVAFFAWRGVLPGATGSADLTVGYSAARAWMGGRNPYDLAVLNNELLAAGGGNLASGAVLDEIRNVYFPTSLPTFGPIALFAWPEARLLALALNVASALFIVFGLIRYLGWRRLAPRALSLMAFFLALAPLRTTIASGQTGVFATAALLAAVLLERSERGALAGVFFGLATALKIQIGLPFVAYVLWRRRWVTASAASIVLAGLTLLSVLRMEAAAIPWLDSWLANLQLLTSPGGLNDPGLLNPQRYSLINLQYLLSSLGANGVWPDVITVGMVGVGALALVWLIRGRHPREELLALSVVAVLTLLVTYHRYYDAVLLAFPIAWGFRPLTTGRWRQRSMVLLLSADFILPVQTNLRDMQLSGVFPGWLTGNAIWDTVVLAQEAWALVLIALVLLWAAVRQYREDDARAPLVGGTAVALARARFIERVGQTPPSVDRSS